MKGTTNNNNNNNQQQQKQSNFFRSVLPHEPPLSDNSDDEDILLGYLQIQGSFTPKLQKQKQQEKQKQQLPSSAIVVDKIKVDIETNDTTTTNTTNDDNDDEEMFTTEQFWNEKKELLECILLNQITSLLLSSVSSVSSSSSSSVSEDTSCMTIIKPNKVQILDPHNPPYTKILVEFDTTEKAKQTMMYIRDKKVTPGQLYYYNYDNNNNNDEIEQILLLQKLYEYHKIHSHRPLLVTQLTTRPLPEPSWTRSSPPKFRRLIARPGEDDTKIQAERMTTRFLVFTNLIDTTINDNDNRNSSCDCYCNNNNNNQQLDNDRNNNISIHEMSQAIRNVINQYDTSGNGIEVFIPTQQSKRTRYCHIGMRSPVDAQNVIKHLQEQIIQWKITCNQCNKMLYSITSGRVFIDYAAITHRSITKATIRDQGGIDEETGKGEPTHAQCTTTTDHIHIPGLILIENYITIDEEETLIATLTGPQAPWAPLQKTQSYVNGTVKRSVQHYGYVFDYQTANVLRDRTVVGVADCPPMPAIPDHIRDSINNDNNNINQDSSDTNGNSNISYNNVLLEDYIQQSVNDGNGWDVLAGIIERTRQYKFVQNDNDNNTIISFPTINQLTVNQYKPGEGIGSHIDTISAFDDGLISISLNSGTVMEFRNVDYDNNLIQEKKLVYLPQRSLLLMSKDARYKWEHMIVNRMTDTYNGTVITRKTRISLTFRTALQEDSNGQEQSAKIMPQVESNIFPPKWGSNNTTNHQSTTDDYGDITTPKCERDHVHAVYDAIATQWHHTRGKRGVLWPGATTFIQNSIPSGSIIADVGCGDGKYFPAIWENGSYVIGTDISEPLLRMAINEGSKNDDYVTENRRVSENRLHLRKHPAVVVGDCMSIPIRTSSCDAAVCIAVMHHLSTRSRRIRCIKELVRIVKPGGLVNVQAWAMEQEEGSRRKFASNDVFVPFNAQPKYLQINRNNDNYANIESSQDNVVATTNGLLDYDNNNIVGKKSTAQMYSEAYDGAEYDDSKGLVVFKRYCHLYGKGELDEIASQVDGVSIIESGFESGNYYIIFKVTK